MSGKKRRKKSAAAFPSNPLLAPSELTVAQLRKVLSERGVSADELKQLHTKALLVDRLSKLDAHRVANALNRRAHDVDQRSGGSFSRLGLSLVVCIAQFLDNRSLTFAACVCKLLRVLLSLPLKGTPSPAFAALRSLDLMKAKSTKPFLMSILSQTQHLQNLSLIFNNVPLPATLLRLSVTLEHKFAEPCLHALAKCPRLQELRVCGHDLSTLRLPSSPPTIRWTCALCIFRTQRAISLCFSSRVRDSCVSYCFPTSQVWTSRASICMAIISWSPCRSKDVYPS